MSRVTKYEYQGLMLTLYQISKYSECKVSYGTLYSRVKSGIPLEEAMTSPVGTYMVTGVIKGSSTWRKTNRVMFNRE